MGAAVGAAVVDATKGPVLPVVVATPGSLGGLLVVAGAGAAVLAALVETGAAGLEGGADACSVVETGGTVGAGVAVVTAADASSRSAVAGGGVGSFVCPAPSLARVALIAAAAASPPVGATVALPATGMVVPAPPGDSVVVDGLGEVSLDTGLAVGSPASEDTLSSRTPGGQHKSHFWVSSQ